MITSYVCVDVETTGLNPKEEKLIEIGAVKVVDGQIVERFQSFLQPGRHLEPRIIALTGITDEMLTDAPKSFGKAKTLSAIDSFIDLTKRSLDIVRASGAGAKSKISYENNKIYISICIDENGVL